MAPVTVTLPSKEHAQQLMSLNRQVLKNIDAQLAQMAASRVQAVEIGEALEAALKEPSDG